VAQTAALLHFLIDTLVVAAATRAVYPPQPPRGSIRNCRLYLSKSAGISGLKYLKVPDGLSGETPANRRS
jgi:hypothetical protein